MVLVHLRHRRLSLRIIRHVCTQIESCYIKSNMTKHIIPKLFYSHELQKNGEIEILQTKSCDNLADLFTKSLPYSAFRKCVEGIGMRRLRDS